MDSNTISSLIDQTFAAYSAGDLDGFVSTGELLHHARDGIKFRRRRRSDLRFALENPRRRIAAAAVVTEDHARVQQSVVVELRRRTTLVIDHFIVTENPTTRRGRSSKCYHHMCITYSRISFKLRIAFTVFRKCNL